MNLDLAQRVWKQITEFPETFSMSTWACDKIMMRTASGSTCGTVACIAGHALFLSGYSFRTDSRWSWINSELIEYPVFIAPDGTEISDTEIPETARKLLDLSDEEYYEDDREYPANALFLDMTGAVTRLRALIEKAEAE